MMGGSFVALGLDSWGDFGLNEMENENLGLLRMKIRENSNNLQSSMPVCRFLVMWCSLMRLVNPYIRIRPTFVILILLKQIQLTASDTCDLPSS
jgi:hypothetical protein